MISGLLEHLIGKRENLQRITLTLSKENIDELREIAEDSKFSLSQVVDMLLFNAMHEWNLIKKATSPNSYLRKSKKKVSD